MSKEELIREYERRLRQLRIDQMTDDRLPHDVYDTKFYMYTIFIRDLKQINDSTNA